MNDIFTGETLPRMFRYHTATGVIPALVVAVGPKYVTYVAYGDGGQPVRRRVNRRKEAKYFDFMEYPLTRAVAVYYAGAARATSGVARLLKALYVKHGSAA